MRLRKEDCSAPMLRVEHQDIGWQMKGVNNKGWLNEENQRDVADSYVAKVRMCWAFGD